MRSGTELLIDCAVQNTHLQARSLSVVLIICTGNTLPGRKKRLKLWESRGKEDSLVLPHAVPEHVPTPALVPAPYAAYPSHKEHKKVWPVVSCQKYHLGTCNLILPFFFFSNQTRLDLAKLYAYRLSSIWQCQQNSHRITRKKGYATLPTAVFFVLQHFEPLQVIEVSQKWHSLKPLHFDCLIRRSSYCKRNS